MSDYDIKVDGEFHQFDGGATRYSKDGKGDFNLIPSNVVKRVLGVYDGGFTGFTVDDGTSLAIMDDVFSRQYEEAIIDITAHYYCDKPTDGKHLEKHIEYSEMFTLFARMLRDLAIHYQKGANVYGVDNWKKGLKDGEGIPESSFFDSGCRHTMQYLSGETDEPHHISAIWNFFGAIYVRDRLWEYEL